MIIGDLVNALIWLLQVPLCNAPYHLWREGGFNAIIPFAARAGVSRVTLLPSQLLQTCSLFRQLGSTPSWPSLRYVTVSGEECPTELVLLFKDIFPQATLLNLYGSTEVAGDVTFFVAYGPQIEVVKGALQKVSHPCNTTISVDWNFQIYTYIQSLVS